MLTTSDLRKAVANTFKGGEYVGVPTFAPDEDAKLRGAIESAIDMFRYRMNTLHFDAALQVLDNMFRAVYSPPRIVLMVGKSVYYLYEAMGLETRDRGAIIFSSISIRRVITDSSVIRTTVYAG